jgi:hypothetical protein
MITSPRVEQWWYWVESSVAFAFLPFAGLLLCSSSGAHALSHVQIMWSRYIRLSSGLYLYLLMLQMLAQRPAQERNLLPARLLVRCISSRLQNTCEMLITYRDGFPFRRSVERFKAHPSAW